MNHQDDKEVQQSAETLQNEHDAHTIAESRELAAQAAFEAQARGEAVDHVPMNAEIKEKAEVVHEQPSDPAPTQAQTQQDEDEEAQVRAQLQDEATPTEQVMRKKVKRAIEHEIKSVEKEVRHLEKKPAENAWELSQAVDMLRKLRDLLANLAYRSAEFVHQLWVEVTQGNSIRNSLR